MSTMQEGAELRSYLRRWRYGHAEGARQLLWIRWCDDCAREDNVAAMRKEKECCRGQHDVRAGANGTEAVWKRVCHYHTDRNGVLEKTVLRLCRWIWCGGCVKKWTAVVP